MCINSALTPFPSPIYWRGVPLRIWLINFRQRVHAVCTLRIAFEVRVINSPTSRIVLKIDSHEPAIAVYQYYYTEAPLSGR